jgi:hypothetical protein
VVDLCGADKTLVYVHKSEVAEYKRNLKTPDIVRAHDKHGLGAIRKYIVEQHMDEDYMFQLDDDVTGMEYKFADKITRIVDPYHFREIIANCHQAALDLETPLFGFVSSPNPFLYTQIDHVHFSGMIACGIGIIPKFLGSCQFDPRLTSNQDQDFCLQVKYYKRYLFMDNRYNFRYGKTWLAEGGCSTIRNTEQMIACRDLLKTKWGNRVVTDSRKKANQSVLKVDF